jgi:hypothetical protein
VVVYSISFQMMVNSFKVFFLCCFALFRDTAIYFKELYRLNLSVPENLSSVRSSHFRCHVHWNIRCILRTLVVKPKLKGS